MGKKKQTQKMPDMSVSEAMSLGAMFAERVMAARGAKGKRAVVREFLAEFDAHITAKKLRRMLALLEPCVDEVRIALVRRRVRRG